MIQRQGKMFYNSDNF